jgi:hypothetical protein
MEGQIEFTYRLVDTINTDHDKYKVLHNSLFMGAAVSSEWILWYHGKLGNIKEYSKGTRTWGVFHGNVLIGIWSVEPKVLRSSGQVINVGRCFAVGIHADYRRHGLFVSLSEYAIQEEKKIGEYEYIVGFPQVGRTVIGGHFKAGWEEVFLIDIYSRKNEPRVFGPSLANIDFIRDFSGVLIPTDAADGIVENAEYYNLRYLKHPDHQYLCYSYKDASIILKPYGNFCHILDLSGSVDNVIYLLEAIRSLAIKHGWLEVNVWCSNKEIYKQSLLFSGFEKGAEFGLSVTFIAVRINATSPLELNECTIQMGVEEGY